MTPLEYFSALVADAAHIPLTEAALSIAQDADPALDLTQVQAELDEMTAKLKKRMPADASALTKLRALNHFFYQELGFAGNINHYDDPHNSYLHRVLHTRRGLPITLAVLFMELAGELGLPVKGVSFPGHFLMKLKVAAGEIVLDPFTGQSLAKEELMERLSHYLPEDIARATFGTAADNILLGYLHSATPAQILLRMLHNLKLTHFREKSWTQALAVQERILLLDNDNPLERRDRGLAFQALECPRAALDDFEYYLAQRPQAEDADDVRVLLTQLKIAVAKLN